MVNQALNKGSQEARERDRIGQARYPSLHAQSVPMQLLHIESGAAWRLTYVPEVTKMKCG
jgi:hypothetical protein